jgi:hypothetical protein
MPLFQALERYTRTDTHDDDANTDVASPASYPPVSFIRKYCDKVDSLDLSGPFSAWYAPSAIFYNADGIVYDGGRQIWEWMNTLFSPFDRMEHLVKTTRVLGGLDVGNRMCDLLILETETSFWLKKPLDGEAVRVPRLLTFLVGPAETRGDGTDGLQIWEAKAYWDSAGLQREVKRRQTPK